MPDKSGSCCGPVDGYSVRPSWLAPDGSSHIPWSIPIAQLRPRPIRPYRGRLHPRGRPLARVRYIMPQRPRERDERWRRDGADRRAPSVPPSGPALRRAGRPDEGGAVRRAPPGRRGAGAMKKAPAAPQPSRNLRLRSEIQGTRPSGLRRKRRAPGPRERARNGPRVSAGPGRLLPDRVRRWRRRGADPDRLRTLGATTIGVKMADGHEEHPQRHRRSTARGHRHPRA